MAHYCSIHKTPFFKKGKMKNYAHPIKDADGNDTGEWCNEPEESEKQEKPFTYSPEKSASIETQVAVKAVTDLWIADKFKNTDDEVVRLRKWILAHIGKANLTVAEDAMPSTNAFDYVDMSKVKEGATKEEAVYALDWQKQRLTAFEKKHPGKSQEFMDKHGFNKKLTKANADILIDEFVILEEAKK